jgi:hypothetical protein
LLVILTEKMGDRSDIRTGDGSEPIEGAGFSF